MPWPGRWIGGAGGGVGGRCGARSFTDQCFPPAALTSGSFRCDCNSSGIEYCTRLPPQQHNLTISFNTGNISPFLYTNSVQVIFLAVPSHTNRSSEVRPSQSQASYCADLVRGRDFRAGTSSTHPSSTSPPSPPPRRPPPPAPQPWLPPSAQRCFARRWLHPPSAPSRPPSPPLDPSSNSLSKRNPHGTSSEPPSRPLRDDPSFRRFLRSSMALSMIP